jgi:hypothetical protein
VSVTGVTSLDLHDCTRGVLVSRLAIHKAVSAARFLVFSGFGLSVVLTYWSSLRPSLVLLESWFTSMPRALVTAVSHQTATLEIPRALLPVTVHV